jgi:hypothetical protein
MNELLNNISSDWLPSEEISGGITNRDINKVNNELTKRGYNIDSDYHKSITPSPHKYR